MGIIQSFVRIKLNHYRMIARAIVAPSIESASLKKKFYDLPSHPASFSGVGAVNRTIKEWEETYISRKDV